MTKWREAGVREKGFRDHNSDLRDEMTDYIMVIGIKTCK